MCEAKFTKGEWVSDTPENLSSQGFLYVNFVETRYGEKKYICNGQHIRVYTSEYHNQTEIQTIANAHLIATAPEMYEMLEYVMKCAAMQDNLTIDANEISKLLAKARGEHV